MRTLNKYFLFFMIFLLLASCKKESEIPDPVITYVSPVENDSFMVLDTVHVVADVSASEPIESIEILLTNEQLQAVLPSQSYVFTQAVQTRHLDLLYPIDEIRLESGNYFILISVKTAHSSKNKYQKVLLNAFPLALKGVLLIQKDNVNTTRISLFDPNQAPEVLGLFPLDYGFAAVSSYDQVLYLGGHHVGDFCAFDLSTKQIRFTIDGYDSPDLACNQGVTAVDGGVHLSRTEEALTYYNLNGKINSVFSVIYPLYPGLSFVYDQYVLVNVLSRSGPESYLRMYHYPWGGFLQEKQLPFKILKMFSPRKDEVLLFGNSAAGPVLQVYYPLTQTTWQPLNALPGKIIAVCRADAGHYFLATTQGVYWYQYQTHTITLFAPITDAISLEFETLSDQLIIARPMELCSYSFPGAVKLMSSPMSDSLQGIKLLYNK